MSVSALEVVRTTTGMERNSGLDLISRKASRPSLRGMFKSRMMSPGRLAQLAFCGNGPMVAIGDAAAYRQTDTGALIFITPVQPLKHGKHLFEIFLFKANPIVLDG